MDIETRVRYVIDDINKKRYKPEIIDALIAEACEDIALESISYSQYIEVTTDAEGYFKVPNNVALLGVVGCIGNKKIPLVSEEAIADKYGCNWRTESTDKLQNLQAIVYGSASNEVFKLYPTVDSLVGIDNIESVLLSTVLVNRANVSSDIAEEKLLIKSKLIPDKENIPRLWETAIVYYVSGQLLRFDKDEQNRVFGNEQMNYYKGKLQLLKSANMKSYVR